MISIHFVHFVIRLFVYIWLSALSTGILINPLSDCVTNLFSLCRLSLFIASFAAQEHSSLIESQVYIGIFFFLPCLWFRKPLHSFPLCCCDKYPDHKQLWDKTCLFTNASRSPSTPEGCQSRNLKTGLLLFHTTLPMSKELTSQPKKYTRDPGGCCWLAGFLLLFDSPCLGYGAAQSSVGLLHQLSRQSHTCGYRPIRYRQSFS